MAKSKTKPQPSIKALKIPPVEVPPAEPVRGAVEPLSPAGQWIGWGVWGSLVLVGFCFGVWAGTSRNSAPVELAEASPAPPTVVIPPPVPAPAPIPPPVTPPPKVVPPMPKVEPPAPAMTPEPPKVTPPPKPKIVPKPPEPAAAVPVVSFAKDIVPVFRSKCFDCHGAASIKGGLDLRTIAAAMQGGDSGAGLKAGDPMNSPVWVSINEGDMPPPGKAPLSDMEKTLVKNWILGGLKP